MKSTKKFIVGALVLVLSLGLFACGKSDGGSANKDEQASAEDTKGAYFKDDKLKVDNYTIDLTDVEVIPKSDKLGMSKPEIVITYKFTNNSKEAITPLLSWIESFTLTQSVDKEDKKLDPGVSMYTSKKYEDLATKEASPVEPGKSVTTVACYELQDTKSPVVIAATDSSIDKELGTKKYKIKGL